MKKLKLALAPTFQPFTHDKIDWLNNTVPFCREGIDRHCQVTLPRNAEYIHVGQINCTHPNPFPIPNGNVIADLEGDEVPGTFREEFKHCIVTASCCPPHWRGRAVFVRPTFSRFLVHAARERKDTFYEATRHQLGFRGKEDSHDVRQKMYKAAQGFPHDIHFVQVWNGHTEPNHPEQKIFERVMLDSSLALCPQGEGIATARLYEACFYGRCPVIIGRQMMVGEDIHDTSFAWQMDANSSVDEMNKELRMVIEMPLKEARERGRLAREYFDAVIRPYFQNPTLSFLEWLERRGHEAPTCAIGNQ